jgi:hypothetical protein
MLQVCVLSFSCLAALSASPAVQAQDDSKAPPALIVVKVGEKSGVVTDGQTVNIGGTPVTVSLNAYKTFSYGGVEFNYPSNFNFIAEVQNPAAKSWTLAGVDFVIRVVNTDKKVTLAGYIEELKKEYEGTKLSSKEVDLSMGGKNFKGAFISYVNGQIITTIDVIPFAPGVFLELEDARGPDGKHTPECQRANEFLQSSLKVK